MEDEDLHLNFKRAELEELGAPFFDKLSELMQRLKDKLTDRNLKINNIEIVGGSVRIPKIQSIIQKVFEGLEIKRTLNFDECISQGASIMSAIVSPFYSVQSTKHYDCFPYLIKLFDAQKPDKIFKVVDLNSN